MAVVRRDPAFAARYGRWALIAGASEGIGAAFAAALAARGLDLVLVARRAEPLAELAAALGRDHGVLVRTLALDLAAADTPAAIAAATADIEVGFVVCNAALSRVGPFFAQPLEEKLRALDVNCRAPLELVHRFGEPMRARGRGGVVLMSSLAGIYGGPYVATYAATKAFSCLLAESLAGELGGDGVDVVACVAGPTRTPTFTGQAAGDEGLRPMAPEAVVAETLAALGRTPRLVPGALNRLTTWLLGQLPRRWVVRLVAAETRKHFPSARDAKENHAQLRV